MKSIKTEFVSQEHYDVLVNDKHLGKFYCTSNWEGFKKMENDTGEILIVDAREENLTDVLNRLSGDTVRNAWEILRASPSIAEKILK